LDDEVLDAKTISTLVAVLAGWLLAQLSGLVKDYWIRRRARRCLLEELGELKSELARVALIYARLLQIHALQGVGNDVPLPVSNFIFKNFYKDAVISLNKEQRLSYQVIHSHIEQINRGIDELRDATKSIHDKQRTSGTESIGKADGEYWSQHVIAGFTNTLEALWHVKHHLAIPSGPALDDLSQTHREYLQYLQFVDDQIKGLLEAAKHLKRVDFEVKYRPEDFLKPFA
jgi:hypothetical protein